MFFCYDGARRGGGNDVVALFVVVVAEEIGLQGANVSGRTGRDVLADEGRNEWTYQLGKLAGLSELSVVGKDHLAVLLGVKRGHRANRAATSSRG